MAIGVGAALALSLAVLGDRLAPIDRVAALIGAVIAAGNSIVAYALVAWSAGRSNAAFFRAILGGMLVRMTFMLGAVVAGVLALGLPRLPLIFSLLAFFVALLAFEVTVVSRRLAGPARRMEAV